jgi:2,3-bisphosphoglycerate-independent phosphoglycerate mutase
MKSSKKLILMILDGWGIGDNSKADAIAQSHAPFYHSLLKKYPHSQLLTHGAHVGLPDEQMGNSEVGHLNLGAGRIVYQDLAKINLAVKDKSFYSHPVLIQAFEYAKKNNKALHLMGLVSPGGIHSHQQHLYVLCDLAKHYTLPKVFIHAFMDGRDCDPKSGLKHIQDLETHLQTSAGKIATVCGRYYAMDRDHRWERIKQAYDLLVKAEGQPVASATGAILSSYHENTTDEFIKPFVIDSSGTIKEGDAVICFNFRTDRCREITIALTQKDMPEYGMKTFPLHYVTLSRYDDTFKNVHAVFEKENLSMTLGEVISSAGKKQLRIAETEKYPHVTFFFSGGREKEFLNEQRIMIPSPKVATYDLQPEMSAEGITHATLSEINKQDADFICLNFANPDMVGHTGSFAAVQKAIEKVDSCSRKIVEAALKNNYSVLLLADHGNAEYMINPNGTPNTAHTTNPVPCLLIDADYKKIMNGTLADIAPTILKIMGMDIPNEMTGRILVED